MNRFNLDKYVQVNERIEKFWEKYSIGEILTEILHIDEKSVVVKATVKAGNIVGVGHAEEFRADGYVNKTSALENCETSAVGRALAFLGFEVQRGIASREEMKKVLAHQETAESNIDYTTEFRPCPDCEQQGLSAMLKIKTVKKEGPNRGKKYWGCENYPQCRYFKYAEEQGVNHRDERTGMDGS